MKCGQESASQPKRGDRKGLWGGIQGGVAPLVMGIMGARPSAIPCAFRRGSAALVGHPPLCEPGLIDGWGQECQCGRAVCKQLEKRDRIKGRKVVGIDAGAEDMLP
ncbi:hypothetical protein MHU86_15739 [Fragilaria crotonensis]|nr:hypothetical protein MHU86_15739 [Fragilaria crotonensis]